MKKIKILLILFLCLSLFFSCGKNDILDSTFEVAPYIQKTQNGIEYITSDVEGYFFYADSTFFEEPTYEDALSGTIRYKSGGTLSYTGLPDKDDNFVIYFRNLIQSEIILILVDKTNEVFCWRQLYLEPGQNYITTRVRFRLWRAGVNTFTYKDGGWTVVLPPSDAEEDEGDGEGDDDEDDGEEDDEGEQEDENHEEE
ncbi:MAG: hypothetical protein LUF90_07835 [Rikenellaceae bacterium]|nr:hypothetical protein [Rikenellaceae bacterium]